MIVILLVILTSHALNTDSAVKDPPVYYFNPVWSPDQKRIAFESTMDGEYAIYTCSPDGSDLKRLTDLSSDNEQPAWSPDGQKIAFISERDGHSQLYMMHADGSNQTRLTQSPYKDYSPAWSPDQKQIVFKSKDSSNFIHNVYIINTDGTGRTRLTDSDYNDLWMSFSPDGNFIVIGRMKVGPGIDSYQKFSEDTANQFEIWLMTLRDQSIVNLTNTTSTNEILPVWAPDSKSIYFLTREDKAHLSQYDLVSQTISAIPTKHEIAAPNISPDGRYMVYHKKADQKWGIYVYDLEFNTEYKIVG